MDGHFSRSFETEGMDNEKEYRKKKLRKELKSDVVVVAVFSLVVAFFWTLSFYVPPVLCYMLRILAIVFSLPLVISFLVSIMSIHRKMHWAITVGSIDEVILEKEDAQPNTTARIRYKDTNGKEHIFEKDLSVYGDDEEGNEERLRKMHEEDRKKYEGKKVPVYFRPKHPKHCQVMLEDAFTE